MFKTGSLRNGTNDQLMMDNKRAATGTRESGTLLAVRGGEVAI